MLAALLGMSSQLTEVVTGSKITVVHPTKLRDGFVEQIHGGKKEVGVLRSSMANFGFFNYGTTLKGRIHYPIANQNACEPFTDADFVEEHLEQRGQHGHRPIIMVDRGTCHFVKKA